MIVVNGEQARVSQRATCRFDLGPSSQTVSAGGGSSSVNVTASASDCGWTATSEVSWIGLTVTSGTGNGTVHFDVAPNPGEQRSGSIAIGGQRATVTQQTGVVVSTPTCSSTISPTSQNVAATGGTGTVAVSLQSGCAWTASSSASWVTITSGSSGTGNGTVAFAVAANTGAARTASLTIAGRAFSVSQAAASAPPPPQPPPPPPAPSCTYSTSPASHNFNALGGTETVNVSTQAGCQWTAVSNASWIGVVAGASGTGNGAVDLVVLPNLGAARTGTVSIADRTFTANQAAVAPCSYSISPNKQKFPEAGGTGSVAVNTTDNCAWTAVSNDPWITITSGASGTGDGTVTFNVAVNTGRNRKGSMTVAGRNAEVEQEDR
jgi:hypothetical protein